MFSAKVSRTNTWTSCDSRALSSQRALHVRSPRDGAYRVDRVRIPAVPEERTAERLSKLDEDRERGCWAERQPDHLGQLPAQVTLLACPPGPTQRRTCGGTRAGSSPRARSSPRPGSLPRAVSTDGGLGSAWAELAKRRTSSLVTRPRLPVAGTSAISTPNWRAIRRVAGVARTRLRPPVEAMPSTTWIAGETTALAVCSTGAGAD